MSVFSLLTLEILVKMGAGESKAVDAELGLFSIEERKILNDEFKELSGTNKVAEKNAMQVSSYVRALF